MKKLLLYLIILFCAIVAGFGISNHSAAKKSDLLLQNVEALAQGFYVWCATTVTYDDYEAGDAAVLATVFCGCCCDVPITSASGSHGCWMD